MPCHATTALWSLENRPHVKIRTFLIKTENYHNYIILLQYVWEKYKFLRWENWGRLRDRLSSSSQLVQAPVEAEQVMRFVQGFSPHSKADRGWYPHFDTDKASQCWGKPWRQQLSDHPVKNTSICCLGQWWKRLRRHRWVPHICLPRRWTWACEEQGAFILLIFVISFFAGLILPFTVVPKGRCISCSALNLVSEASPEGPLYHAALPILHAETFPLVGFSENHCSLLGHQFSSSVGQSESNFS